VGAREREAGHDTGEIDAEAERIIRARGATPIPGLPRLPASICSSVNEEVVHGIPGKRRLKQGDLIGIDVGARWGGFVGDAAVTLPIGKVSPEAQRLIDTCGSVSTWRSPRPGGSQALRDRGAVQVHAESRGYTLVREYAGHGIGRHMHEEPSVPNYVDARVKHRDHVLRPGMAICIEPWSTPGGTKFACSTMTGPWSPVTVAFPPF